MNTCFTASLAVAGLVAGCASSPHKAKEDYPYNSPLVSPGTKFGALPPDVQHTVRAEAGTADVYDVRKLTQSGRIIYEILFSDHELFPPLYVASDGSVLTPDLTVLIDAREDANLLGEAPVHGVTLQDLPTDVLKTVLDKVPSGDIGRILKFMAGNNVVYEVSFKDHRAPNLFVAEDGTVIAGGSKLQHAPPEPRN